MALDYQQISDKLIKSAGNHIPGTHPPDEKGVYDSVKLLCDSSEGGLTFADAISKITNAATKKKVVLFLKWVYEKTTSNANDLVGRIELIKPLMLTSIGAAVTWSLGMLEVESENSLVAYIALVSMILCAFGFFLVLWRLIKKRNAELDISIKSSSLIEIAKID